MRDLSGQRPARGHGDRDTRSADRLEPHRTPVSVPALEAPVRHGSVVVRRTPTILMSG